MKTAAISSASGNTAYWKVRWEDEGQTTVVHKWRGELDDPLWADPATRKDATHLWSHLGLRRPEAEMTGLSFLYGGYHRLGRCVGCGGAAFMASFARGNGAVFKAGTTEWVHGLAAGNTYVERILTMCRHGSGCCRNKHSI